MPSLSTPANIHSDTTYLVSDDIEAFKLDIRTSLLNGGGSSELSRTINKISFWLKFSAVESEKSRSTKEDFILFSDLQIAHKNEKREKK
jgi:hypothetical protein